MPPTLNKLYTDKMPILKGENPHQKAALYVPQRVVAKGLPQAEQVQGKDLHIEQVVGASQTGSAVQLLMLPAEYASASARLCLTTPFLAPKSRWSHSPPAAPEFCSRLRRPTAAPSELPPRRSGLARPLLASTLLAEA